jgi:hypothetical protein
VHYLTLIFFRNLFQTPLERIFSFVFPVRSALVRSLGKTSRYFLCSFMLKRLIMSGSTFIHPFNTSRRIKNAFRKETLSQVGLKNTKQASEMGIKVNETFWGIVMQKADQSRPANRKESLPRWRFPHFWA